MPLRATRSRPRRRADPRPAARRFCSRCSARRRAALATRSAPIGPSPVAGSRRRPSGGTPAVLLVQFAGVRTGLGVIAEPASIRASSSTRAVASSSVTVVRTAASSPSLTTRKCASANAATCGRWVTVSTCRRAASDCISRPTVPATAPPMPVSTSSKISVGTAPASLVTTCTASAIRDSSPPDATRASGPSGCFGCPATRNSTCSHRSSPARRPAPARLRSGRRPSPVPAWCR